jgi:hypothetical protein
VKAAAALSMSPNKPSPCAAAWPDRNAMDIGRGRVEEAKQQSSPWNENSQFHSKNAKKTGYALFINVAWVAPSPSAFIKIRSI